MPREYRYIKQYENEMLQLKSEGLTIEKLANDWKSNKLRSKNSERDTEKIKRIYLSES